MRVMRQLHLVGTKVDVLVSGVARRYGLSHAALNALAVVEAAGGPLPAGEVSTAMHISTATMTSVLDTLERKGYVQRQPDAADRRRVLVDMTPDARAVLDQLLPELQQRITATLRALDDEMLEGLLGALEAVAGAIDAAPDDLPPPPPRRTPGRLRRT